jgi:hypothetical protein
MEETEKETSKRGYMIVGGCFLALVFVLGMGLSFGDML